MCVACFVYREERDHAHTVAKYKENNAHAKRFEAVFSHTNNNPGKLMSVAAAIDCLLYARPYLLNSPGED